MIFTMSILINVCLILAVYVLSERTYLHTRIQNDAIRILLNKLKNSEAPKVDYNRINGKLERVERSAAIAEKLAERAFNMASSSTLGVIALQKSLATPRLLTRPQVIKNQLAKEEVDKLFTTEGQFDFLRPILSDEDNEILDNIENNGVKNH